MSKSSKFIQISVYIFLALGALTVPNAGSEPGQLGRLEKISIPDNNPYAKIDIKENNEVMKILMGDDNVEKAVNVQKILEHPEKFNPPALYFLSYVLFQDGRKDEAMFWFYAGQLRGRYDANRCADESANTAVQQLNEQIGPYINPYAFQDLDKLKKTVADVMAWDNTTPYLYDHRWINLHGMNAMSSALKSQDGSKVEADPVMSLPESQWGEIHRKTQEDYMAGFKEALEILKERKAGL